MNSIFSFELTLIFLPSLSVVLITLTWLLSVDTELVLDSSSASNIENENSDLSLLLIFFCGPYLGIPRSWKDLFLDPMFFHSDPNVGGSVNLLGWMTGARGSSCPGNLRPCNPLNSGQCAMAML